MIRECCSLLRSREFSRFFGVLLLLLLVFPAVSLWAAEGTAHLTFRKAVLSKDTRKVYIIRNGDTITRILRKLGRAAPRYRAIRQLNPHITDINRIYPGQKLFLARPEEQSGAVGDALEVSNYTAKEGDSITRIILSELHIKPSEAVRILRLIKQLNSEVTDFNKIYPGQVIKIPRRREARVDSDKLSLPAPAKSAEEEKVPATPPPATEKYLPVIRHIIEQLNGKVITSGNHYIPLPGSGQIIVDGAIVPIIEMGDGTMIMLDHAGRMPDILAGIIQSHWKNYHLVRIASGQGIASVLQEIIRSSPSFQMVKVETPLSIDDITQVKLSLDWLITRKSPSGSASSQLGLIFAADKSQPLPSSAVVKCAMQKGINVCEILEDKTQGDIPGSTEFPRSRDQRTK